ncbi:MAG: hypothetical protein RLZZ574_751 [Cyanobacteriota bacterium]|jgi:hypothetical protein
MTENRNAALKIATIASLLIERESEPSLALLGTNLNTEFYEGKYLIKLQVIPERSGANYLVIKAEDDTFLIEMLNGNLLTAFGIEDEDIDYWRQLELTMYS